MKKMLELKKGNYVAIVDNNRLVEVEAESQDKAEKILMDTYGYIGTEISICIVPDCITVLSK